MRTLVVLLIGVVLGVAVTVGGVAVSGGWYTYFILPTDVCHREYGGGAITAEVVPNQPNPCHFRRPRWSLP